MGSEGKKPRRLGKVVEMQMVVIFGSLIFVMLQVMNSTSVPINKWTDTGLLVFPWLFGYSMFFFSVTLNILTPFEKMQKTYFMGTHIFYFE